MDELGLWKEFDEEERALANSPVVIRDEALNAYVRNLLCNAVGADRCNATRIYILRTPIFNATMAANGTMRVFSGLLLRVRSEAELGAVLGHEFGHFEKRHSLAKFKAHRSSTDLLSWAYVLASMSNSVTAGADFNRMQLSVYGRLYRFGRDQEREADLLGVGYLNRSAYRPQAAAQVWKNLMTETEASSRARGLNKPNFEKIAFFATHPPEAERAITLSALAAPEAANRDDGAERYRQALSPWLPTFLDDQVKLNDFGASDYLIATLGETGWSATLWRARGDLYRARGNPRDFVQAAEFYSNAIKLDPMLADAHRGLGLALFKAGRRSEGQLSLKQYLKLKPDASDAGSVAMLLSTEGTN